MTYNYTIYSRFLFLILFMVLVSFSAFSQTRLSHKSDWFIIEQTTDVYIRGNITSLDSNADAIINLGDMYFTDTVTCNGINKIFGEFPDTLFGNVYMVGNKAQHFMGSNNMRFGNITIQNSYDSLFLSNNVDIYNKLQLDAGNVYISDFKSLDFLLTGRLIGETNSKRIFGNNYSVMHISRPLINGNTYSNIGGFGIDLTINGNLGVNTHIWRKNVQQVNIANGSIDRFYSFSPENNGFVSSPKIHYLDTIELHGNKADSINMYLSQTNGNTWVNKGGVNDIINDNVSADASLSFMLSNQSMLTLAEAICDNPPYLHFAEDTIPLCNNSPAWLFAEGTIGNSSIWNNGIINSDSIQITSAGTYEVTITDIYGCPSTDSVVVIIAPNPVADFSIPSTCVGSESNFTNSTTILSGTVNYAWDLNDIYSPTIDSSSLENPSIIYTNQGSYSVNLIATSNYGCTNTKTKLSIVNPYPTVSYSMTSNCADSLIIITNTTHILPNNTITYSWDFGDGNTSLAEIPTHSFSDEGSYLVELQATASSCTSSLSKTIVINPNPIASFTASDACLGQNSSFINSTTISSGSTNYSWNFEPGSNSVLTNPSYPFTSSGAHPIKLIAISDNGCMHDTIISVMINALPIPVFTANATCQEDTMIFINTSNNTSSFSWNFNGTAQSTDYNPENAFNSSGTKTIELTETDINGCVNSSIVNVLSKPKPSANFIPIDGCEQENITFLNTTSTPSGNMTYSWNFDDASTSVNMSPSHLFTTAANYNVELIAENNGCFDTIIKTTTIHPKPILDFGTSVATCSDSLILDAQNSGSTFLWSNLSTQQQLNVTYNGTYWVEITSDHNCTESDTVIATLNSAVNPSIGEDSLFCDSTILNAGYYGSNFLWSTGATTQSIYVNSSATVWVEVTDANNCVGYDTIIAGIANSIHPDLGTDLLPCDGEIISLNTSQTGMTYLWNTGETTDTIDVSQSNAYWVELIDNNNCVSYDTVIINYNPNPILSLGIDTNYCDTAYFDISQNNATYLWEDGSTLANRIITDNGTYWAAISNTITGCVTKDTVNISTSITPIIYLGADSALCNGEQILLDALYPQYQYQWNIGDTTQTIIAAASGFYSVDVISPEGCIGNDSIEITISNPLDPYLGQDFVLCKNNIAEISSPIDAANYLWILNDTLLNETSQMISISEPGELISIVTTDNNCIAQDTLNLLLTNSEINAEFIAATDGVYVDDTVQFINLSYPVAYTSVWDFGDGFYSIIENPTHVYTQIGEYYVILEANNGICSDTVMKKITVELASKKRIKIIDKNQILSYKLYPNPNDGAFRLSVELLEKTRVIIECFDIYGRLIMSDIIDSKKFTTDYNIRDLSTGMYVMRISINEESEYIKFIKN